ncbi:hypothetical protein D3C87_35430 [compost metagenome]
MKRKMRVVKLPVMALVLVLMSAECKKKNPIPEPEPTPVTCSIVEVTPNGSATISSPTTWTAGNVYVVTGDVTVTSVLTIEPGTIVKLSGSSRLQVINTGKILANGTAANHVVFTSLNDDSYCGDSNGDGTATTPAKGDWGYIYLNGGTGHQFTYCDVLYAGNPGAGPHAVYIAVTGVSFNFDHCTFAHTLSNANSSSSFVFHGGSYMNDPSVSKFTNNVFYDNDRPLYCSFDYTVNTNNSFHNPSNPAEKNTRNGIFMWGGIGTNVSYNVSEVPYVFMENFNGGGSAAVRNVNIGNNVVLKFMQANWGISRGANNHINLGSGVIFTSFKDDNNGGDTNGDGNLSAPATGDWDGFWDYAAGAYVSGGYILYAAH